MMTKLKENPDHNSGQQEFYTIVPAFIKKDKRLSAAAKLVFSEIRSLILTGPFKHNRDFAWISNKTLAKNLGIGEATASRAVIKLEELGYLITLREVNENSNLLERRVRLGPKGGLIKMIRGV